MGFLPHTKVLSSPSRVDGVKTVGENPVGQAPISRLPQPLFFFDLLGEAGKPCTCFTDSCDVGLVIGGEVGH